MNKNTYRVIFNAARGLWTAVQETATANGRGRPVGTARGSAIPVARWDLVDLLSMRHIAFAALCALGMQPMPVDAQVVAAPGSAGSKPIVGVTANGLPIVQIATPNSAGVSNNGYTQYNVSPQGLILNNAQGNALTQQAGYVTGNPNLASGSARVIVNQVVGGSPSQLLGYTEVAGQRAEVVIANPAGIYCNGCGFINTSRGILTTGTPVFGGTGSLDAFHVTGGQIQIGAAGLNGSNVDQVDLIARSVAINGKVWAGQSLNVVTGNNEVRHDDLSAQSLGQDGNSQGVAIDVAQLGGMYAGKIRLVGTETGVGVNSAGTIASQAGDVQLSSQGKVTLSGTTSATGNVTITGAGDVSNSGSIYATQNTTLNSQSQLTSSGTVAALGNTTLTGASVNSTGALGAGVDANGNITGSGSLAVSGAGSVSTTGQQIAGGNLAMSGSSLNMAAAQTLAKGNVSLTATGAGGDTGNIAHAGGALQAGGSLTANASGAFANDQGQVSAAQLNVTAGSVTNRSGTLSQTGAGDMSVAASGAFDNTGGTVTTNAQNVAVRSASLSNANGKISQAGTGSFDIQTDAFDNGRGNLSTNGALTVASASLKNGAGAITSARSLDVESRGDIDNTAGQLEAAGAVNVSAANVQNTAGRIVSENADGLTLSASGQLTNAAGTTAQAATGGVIGGNGDATIKAASLTNSGTVTAAHNLALTASGTLDNSSGTLSGAMLAANAASLKNANGAISANTVSITVPQFDNSGGQITANQLAVNASNLTNEHGKLTQLGSGAMGLGVSGTLDNSNGGVIQTNSTDLTLAPALLNNNGGTLTHAGTGTLTIDSANGAGAVTNVDGTIVSNGRTALSAASVDNTGGTIGGQTGLDATLAGPLNNSRGQLESNGDLSLSSDGSLTNTSGTIAATGNVSVQAASLANSGTLTAGKNLDTTVAGALDNSGGTFSAQTVTTRSASFTNAVGVVSGNTVSMAAPQLDNSNGRIIADRLAVTATNLTNGRGSLTQLGSGAVSLDVSNTLDNSNGGVIQTNSTDLSLASASINNNGGTITHAGTGTLTIDPGNGAGALTNVGGRIVSNGQASMRVASLNNSGGTLASQGAMSAIVQAVLNNTNGRLSSGSALTVSSIGALLNAGGVIGAGGAVTGSTLNLTAASIDNSGGAITNVGTGATTVSGGSQIANSNVGGVSGMGSISGNGNVTVSASSVSNTQGGQLSGANLQIDTGNLDNSGGAIGNVANTAGDVGITTGTLKVTNGQINASRNLSVAANTLLGGGRYSAVNDLTLNLRGSFASDPNYSFNAGRNLTFTLPGTFSNAGAFVAVNGLRINAGDIANSGTLAAGGLLSTRSNTLTNTGTIVGGSVSLSAAQILSNLGTSALIGATDSAGKLELLSADIENRDDTTATDAPAMTAIYGLGQVILAGGKDANGNYLNANLVRNQSGLIQSGGDMQIAANQVTNTRRAMSTSGFTSSVDPDLLSSLGISLSGCVAFHMEACSGQNVGWADGGDPTMIGGAYIEPPHGGQWNSGYQYTTYAGVAVANTVTTVSPGSQIIAGRNLNLGSVGMFQNYWSQVAAAGNIAAPAVLDQNSWQGQTAPQVQVTYSGQYHYNNYDNSEHNWQLPFGDAPFIGNHPGGYSQAAPADIRTYALPAYESTFTAGGTLSGTGVIINNTAGNASVTPLGLLPGQSVSGTGAGAVSGTISAVGGVSAGTAAVQGGHIANSSLANFNNPIIAAATAVSVLSNITLPRGGLFSVNTAPNAPYLVETNPAFTSQQQWLSSDYYFQQMGMNPGQIQLRLGDGFYEQKLVQDQIMSMTGKSVLTNYADAQDEYKALMTSGAQLAQSLNLAPGTGLSAEQVAQLTSNVVIMQSEVIDGQTVLVPVVYLAKASQENMGNGPVIAATNIDLQNAKSVTNSGTISATNSFSIGAQSIDSSFGTLQAGGPMALVSAGDINLTSATLNAGSLALQTGGDLILDTAVKTLSQVSDNGATRVTTTLGPAASINVTGNAVIVTGGDFEQNAGNLNVGGALGMSIGGDWNLGVQQTGEHKVVERANGVSDTDMNQVVGSSVKVGGQSNIAINGDLTAAGADINLGQGGTLAAKGNVTLGTASATSTVNSSSSGDEGTRSYAETLHRSDQTLTGTMLESGNTLNIVSGKDITVSGSAISLDKGSANLVATGNVTIGAASETHEFNAHETHSHSEIVSGTKVSSSIDQSMTLNQGSMISADSVKIVSGNDINVIGSNIVGTNDVTLKAVHDVTITTSQDTQSTQTDYSKQEWGFLSGMTALNQLDGGLQGYSVGVRKTTDAQQTTQVTNNSSMIGSVNGNLTVVAGNDLHATDAILYAANDMGLAGRTVTIDAAQNTFSQSEQQSLSQTAITAGISNPVLAAAMTANQMRQDVKHTNGDARLDALAAATTGLAVKNAIDAVASNPSAAGGIGISVSLGTSHSNSNSNASSSTAVGSSVTAGHNLTIAAAGAGADSDINVIGSNLSAANNTTLIAAGDINLHAAQSADSVSGTNSGSSASIGATLALGEQTGLSFQLGVSGTKGNGNGSDTTWTNTHVTAGNTLTLQSGGDTNLIGAVADAQHVVANVGGDLNIASLQDVSHYDSKQTGGGVSISVCVPPICYGGGSSVAANFSQEKMNSDYASVTEQSGIHAGDGGFQIDVKGNTDLKGAVISSSDQAVLDDLNSLTTGTLTHSDIANHAAYDASSVGVSGGYGVDLGKTQTGVATNVNPVPGTTLANTGGGTGGGFAAAPPVALSASGDAGSTTRSAISGGVITITDGVKQQQLTGQTAEEAVAGISRDTTATANTIAPIFDKDKIQAGFDITSQFVNQVGTFVSNRAKEADAATQAAKDPNLTPEQRAEAQQRADELNKEWGPGGEYRQVLTALTVATGGNVTGGMGQYAQAATVAYLQELGAVQVKDLIRTLDLDQTPQGEAARAALHAIVGCAGAAGSGASCGAGAMGAAASSVIGSLLKPTDDMTAEQRLARENLVNNLIAGVATGMGASGANTAAAAGAGQIEAQNNQVGMLGPKKNPLSVELVKTYCATGTCTDEQVKLLVQVQNQMNEASGNNAMVVAGSVAIVAAIPALATLGPEALALALSNPAAAVNAGIITVETAAAIATNSMTPGVVVEVTGTKAVSTGAESAVSYAGLKLDLKTTQAANELVDSLRTTGQLPSNYVTKSDAYQQGWQEGKAVNNYVPGGQIGGDIFRNSDGLLPSADGRIWYEADIGLNNTMSRSNPVQPASRLLYSSDGLLYVTADHYKTAISIGLWK
ncbi:hemagglutinin repeat-containing protein [Paraburkholderia humisilvae]|uniref:tRNA nuclease CdiA-2 n=1 Tax=Paraburkholderia humisilvae TaxID=627669 RepID=A0A6J5D8H9_9BURK|nr:hemagglutinin repeat-containing protein [Paraburkholderia humisilvae]CAB3749046.1 tRNA nuclease CdiA-2 [Paraburkholderia humisilvae]